MTLQMDPEENEIRFLNLQDNFSNQRVLEIGCGDGRLTWRYAHSAGSVTAIDLDAQSLKVATADCPVNLARKVSFAQASALDLPFHATTFDRAILAWSF